MALQVLPQQTQPIGLQLLGNQLQTGVADYAQRRDLDRRRQDMLTDEARRLNERRQDIDVARSREDTRFDRLRGLQLDDEQRRRGEGFEDAEKKVALEARLKMLGEAARMGIFDIQQIGNMEAENVALAKLQSQLSSDATFANEQPRNAQARLAQLTAAEQEVTRKMAEVERRLSSQPTVDQSQVAAAATQIATQANGGKMPSREQIQAALPDALAAAQNEAQVRWWQDQKDAGVQYQLLNSQLNTIRQQQSNLTSTFKVAPTAAMLSPGAAPTASAAPVTPTPGGNPLAGFIDSLNAQVPPPSTAAPEAQAIQQTTQALRTAPAASAPILRQGRTQMLAGEYEKLDAPVVSAQAELANVSKQIQLLQQGLTPWQGVDQSPFEVNPEAQGQMMTDLLIKQEALRRKEREAQAARSAGKTSLLSTIPAMNTQSGYKPITPPSAGALLSPR